VTTLKKYGKAYGEENASVHVPGLLQGGWHHGERVIVEGGTGVVQDE
jgi:hypothetical protein